MNKSIIWLKSNWIILSISVFSILIHFAIRYWYYHDMKLVFGIEGTTIFNNVLTPLTGMITIGLLIYTIYQSIDQSKLVARQHLIIESSRRKEMFLVDYENAKKKLEMNFAPHIIGAVGFRNGQIDPKYVDLQVNALNYIPFLRTEIRDLVSNTEYESDYLDFENDIPHQFGHYRNRSYLPKLRSIIQIGTIVDLKYEAEIGYLLRKIESLEMLSDDQIFLRRKIENDLLMDYIEFVRFEMDFHIPDIEGRTGKDIPYVKYNTTPLTAFLRKHDQYFG